MHTSAHANNTPLIHQTTHFLLRCPVQQTGCPIYAQPVQVHLLNANTDTFMTRKNMHIRLTGHTSFSLWPLPFHQNKDLIHSSQQG